MKRILSLALAIILVLTMFPLSVFAADKVKIVRTITAFDSNTSLNKEQYNLLATGTIGAKKVSGVWYYTFTKSGKALYVKTTAFSSSVDNNYSDTNKFLTDVLMNGKGGDTCRYIYKARTGKTSEKVKKYEGSGKTTLNKYTTYFANIGFTVTRTNEYIKLWSEEYGHVQFIYSDRVVGKTVSRLKYYKLPTTEKEYLKALKRTTGNVSTTIVPTFELDITQPGTNKVYFTTSDLYGKGIVDKEKNITEYIDVALAVGKVGATIATGKLPFESLYKLYKEVVKMVPKSEEYNNNKTVLLSRVKKKDYCLKYKVESPVALKSSGDYFRTEVWLNKKPSTSGTKTKMKIKVTIAYK